MGDLDGMDGMEVRLSSGTADDDVAVANLFVAYFYEQAAWDPGIEITRFGLPVWRDFGLPGPRKIADVASHNWWIRDDCTRHVLRVDDAAAGFAVVSTDAAFLPGDVDADLVDFYVTGKFRRRGVGRAGANQVLDTVAGRWQLFTLAANTAAQAFWRSVLAERCGPAVQVAPDATEFRFSSPA